MKNCKESICLANVNGECAVEECKGVHVVFNRTNKIISKTIGQFTGLTDKNGIEIYEGDFVECKNWEYNIFYVFYSEHFHRLHLMPLSDGRMKNEYAELGVHIFEWIYPKNKLEIIGNIYDNPELLQGKDD